MGEKMGKKGKRKRKEYREREKDVGKNTAKENHPNLRWLIWYREKRRGREITLERVVGALKSPLLANTG